MHVMNDTTDPFYTSLRAGAYAAKKPGGHPCDPAYKCKPKLNIYGRLGIASTILILCGVIACFRASEKRKLWTIAAWIFLVAGGFTLKVLIFLVLGKKEPGGRRLPKSHRKS